MAAETLDCRVAARGVLPVKGQGSVFEIAKVYEQHFRYVWRCLRSLGVADAQLDDALQDVFIVVQRRLSEFDGQAQISTWLYAIALRVARKYRQRAQRDALPLTSVDEEQVCAPMASQTEAAVQAGQRLRLARQALDALDDEKREVFVLTQVEQMSAKEVAEIVGAPINTVYSRLRAARQAFAVEVQRLASRTRKLP